MNGKNPQPSMQSSWYMVRREWGGERELPIEAEGATLEGTLVLPKDAKGLVLLRL